MLIFVIFQICYGYLNKIMVPLVSDTAVIGTKALTVWIDDITDIDGL